MVEIFLELQPSVFDTVCEGLWSPHQELQALFECYDVLLACWICCFSFVKDFESTLGCLGEQSTEQVSCPFNAVKGLLREHLESTMGNLVVVLWILLRAVALSQMRQDDLDMPFGSKRTTFEQRCLGCNASSIHVPSRSHVVQGIRDYRQPFKELISEDMFRRCVNLVEPCDDVSLQLLVHPDGSGSCSCRLWLSQMLLSEQELSIQVADLNHVRVCQNDRASFRTLLGVCFTTSNSEHGIILEQLTANCSSTDHEQVRIGKSINHILTNDDSQTV